MRRFWLVWLVMSGLLGGMGLGQITGGHADNIDTTQQVDPLRDQYNVLSDSQQVASELEKRIRIQQKMQQRDYREEVVYQIQPLRQEKGQQWVMGVIVVLFVLLVTIWLNFQRNVVTLVRAIFNIRIAEQLHHQEELTFPVYAIFMSVLFYLAGGLYIYHVVQYFNISISPEGFLLYLYLTAVVTILYMIRYIGLKFISWLFPFGQAVDFYSFTISIINRFLGMLLAPTLFLLFYGHPLLISVLTYLSLGIVGVAIIMRYIRAVSASWQYIAFYKTYFFTYLCSTEVAPIIILLKLILIKLN